MAERRATAWSKLMASTRSVVEAIISLALNACARIGAAPGRLAPGWWASA